MNRRFVLAALLAIGAAIAAPSLFQSGPDTQTLTAQDAFERAAAGSITLIDIRTPREWAQTGVGQGAVPIDMRARDFSDQLLQATQGKTDAPIALICASGGRSARLATTLAEAGFTNVADVSEGMLGSRAGPGWIAQGLPVIKN